MRAGRKAEQLDQPADDLVFDDRGRVIELGDLRIHARGEHVGEHGERGAGADHPAPEAWMDVAGGVGQHVALELLIDLRGGRRVARRGSRQPLAHLGGHRPPDGTLARGPQEFEHLVHHQVAEVAQLVPPAVVGGVERDLRLGHSGGASNTW